MNTSGDSSDTDSDEEFQARQARIQLASPKYRAELLRRKELEDAAADGAEEELSAQNSDDDDEEKNKAAFFAELGLCCDGPPAQCHA